MDVLKFANKWRTAANLHNERQGYQMHFSDLCDLLQHPKPTDPDAPDCQFERTVNKAGTDDRGFADVWKRHHFAFEYKRKGRDLGAAYRQLVLYQHDLDNPPLLVVTDFVRFQVHTNFTGTSKHDYHFTLDDLENGRKVGHDYTALEILNAVFHNPEQLNPRFRRERITQAVTSRIAAVARSLKVRETDQQRVSHFLMRLVFALFAEDAGLLENKLVQRVLKRSAEHPEKSQAYLAELFDVMSTGGEMWGQDVRYFNGGLFDGRDALALTREELLYLVDAADLDWADVEPSIFGTLFEESLSVDNRRALGAHYTNVDDILRIVEPVVIQPLLREWEAVKRKALEAAAKRGGLTRARELVLSFHHDLSEVRVLDAACGSGNFLYVTLKRLLDLEHEVRAFALELKLGSFAIPPKVHPRQMLGIEIEPFAAELASATLWIGYIQWHRSHGGHWNNPVLEKLDNIRQHDALLNEDGTEYTWPQAKFIVGNPPFLGGKMLRTGLGDGYVDALFQAYGGRVARESDLVCYWFEKARASISQGTTMRAGLIATNSIRGGANRKVLQRLDETGAIFEAWCDQSWAQDGAAVRVSMVCFDGGAETQRYLDGIPVSQINADLTANVDMTRAVRLKENEGVSFMGTTKGGPFDLPGDVARPWLNLPNPNGRSNAEAVRPWVNGLDITRRPRDMWIIDFALMDEPEASEFLVPFEYIKQHVKPERETNRRAAYRDRWWLHAEARPAMRKAFGGLSRYIGTARVAKHRLFTWLPLETVPDSQVIVIARDDDFTFGVLHSGIHELWSRRQGTWMGAGNDLRYTPTTCFETFPFPYSTPEHRVEVEKWATYLNDVRGQLLSTDPKATLTGLYNALEALRLNRDASHSVFALLIAHERLDAAVAAAYGWELPLDEQTILERLLSLNAERAAVRPTTQELPVVPALA